MRIQQLMSTPVRGPSSQVSGGPKIARQVIGSRTTVESGDVRLVVRVGLRKHVPLRADVEGPQHRLEDLARRDRLAARTIIGILLHWNVLPHQFPSLFRYA